MQTNTLVSLFNQLLGTGKLVRFGDLMTKGFNQYSIQRAIKLTGVKLDSDSSGYTIIKF